MIKIAITEAAFDALASTLPLGSVAMRRRSTSAASGQSGLRTKWRSSDLVGQAGSTSKRPRAPNRQIGRPGCYGDLPAAHTARSRGRRQGRRRGRSTRKAMMMTMMTARLKRATPAAKARRNEGFAPSASSRLPVDGSPFLSVDAAPQSNPSSRDLARKGYRN